jgi:hypothetical protein
MGFPLMNQRQVRLEQALTKRKLRKIRPENMTARLSTATLSDSVNERASSFGRERQSSLTKEFGACSPLREAMLKGQKNIVPFKAMHRKTYFKTIEHVLQNQKG